MKMTRRIALGAALLLMAAAAVPQAHAACAGGQGLIEIALGGSLYLDLPGGNPYPAGYSYYPTVTANRTEQYWELGQGVPGDNVGNDDGGVPFISGGESAAYPGYFYPATVYGSPWGSDPQVDGCPSEPNFDPTSCLCVLITDEWDGDGDGANEGYFAIMSDLTDGGGNFRDLPNGTVALARTPAPIIQTTARAGANLTMDVRLDPLGASGIYLDPACTGCGPIGFKVMINQVGSGASPPSDRSAGWSELTGIVTDLAATEQVVVDCSAEGDLYLATRLVGPDTYETGLISSNSVRVTCDPNLADPGSPRVRPIRPNPRGARPGKAGGR